MKSWFEKAQEQYIAEWLDSFREQLMNDLGKDFQNKEDNTMKVSYKGTTGLLQKLERQEMAISCGYILEIWDCSRECKISFSNVSLKDVKFLGGEVTYG